MHLFKESIEDGYESDVPPTGGDKAVVGIAHETVRDNDNNDDDSIDGDGDTQVDNFATYGQLVGPPSYEESVMYDRVMQAGADTEETVDNAQGPPVIVSITEYQKQELPMVLGMSSKRICKLNQPSFDQMNACSFRTNIKTVQCDYPFLCLGFVFLFIFNPGCH